MLYTPQARLDALHAALKAAGERFLVVMHDYPDPDCLASSMGMQRILSSWQTQSDIVFGGGMGRPGNKAMKGLLDLNIKEFAALDLGEYAGAILVDTQPGAGNNSLPENIPVLWVIDNHSPAPGVDGEVADEDKFDLRNDSGATSSIVWEYLGAAGIKLDGPLATALLLGLKTDTEGLAREARPHGVRVFALTPGMVRTAMTEHMLESEAGLRWLASYRTLMADGSRWVDPATVGAVVVALASGRADALSGRWIHAPDDLDRLVERAEEIEARNLHVVRLRE